MDINLLTFKDSLSAWEGVNMYLVQKEKEVWHRGGGIYGTEFISYDNIIRIKNLKLDPEFDFGMILGYKDKKWASLVNNYVDFNYLDLIKSEVQLRTKKTAKSYNYAYHFSNYHGGGKDCLISLNFTKRINKENPIVVFQVRTSEVTKRLIFDLLLVQRMVEYVYGKKQQVELHIVAPSIFITAEHFSVFNNQKPIKKILKPYRDNLGRFQQRIVKILKEFKTTPLNKIKYRSWRKMAAMVQRGEDGLPKHNCKPLKAKELLLFFKEKIKYPEDCVTPTQRAAFRKNNDLNRKYRKRRKNK